MLGPMARPWDRLRGTQGRAGAPDHTPRAVGGSLVTSTLPGFSEGHPCALPALEQELSEVEWPGLQARGMCVNEMTGRSSSFVPQGVGSPSLQSQDETKTQLLSQACGAQSSGLLERKLRLGAHLSLPPLLTETFQGFS